VKDAKIKTLHGIKLFKYETEFKLIIQQTDTTTRKTLNICEPEQTGGQVFQRGFITSNTKSNLYDAY
jgi:hypothetical protein